MMLKILVIIGIMFIILGLNIKRKENKFDKIMNDVLNNNDDQLNVLKQSTDIISIDDEIVERLNSIENRLNQIEINRESEYQKMLNDIDIKNKSANELAKLTGMKKGEVLLLKRLLQE